MQKVRKQLKGGKCLIHKYIYGGILKAVFCIFGLTGISGCIIFHVKIQKYILYKRKNIEIIFIVH